MQEEHGQVGLRAISGHHDGAIHLLMASGLVHQQPADVIVLRTRFEALFQ